MRKIKASLIGLMTFSIAACSTIEVIHVPVGCLGLPVITVRFTQEEADLIPASAIDKIVLMRETYKERIKSQCDINNNYDKLYGEINE